MPVYPGDGITFPYVYADSCRATGAALPAISLVILALRLYTRRSQCVQLGWDDYTAVFAWISLTCMGGIFVYGTDHHGLCWPTPSVPAGMNVQEALNYIYIQSQTRSLLKQEFWFQLCMLVTYGLTKFSIVLFLRRIYLGHGRNTFDYVTRILLLVVAMWTIVFLFTYIFACGTHVSATWGALAENKAYCLQAERGGGKLELTMAASDLALDVACLYIPFPVIWHLHLSLIQKSLLTGIFMVGCMTVASSIARLVIYVQILNTASNPPKDINLTTSLSLWWSLLEAGLAFIASQLPTLGQYIRKLIPGFFYEQFRRLYRWISAHSGSGNAQDSSHEPQATQQLPIHFDQVQLPRRQIHLVDSWDIRSQSPANKHSSHEVYVLEDDHNWQ